MNKKKQRTLAIFALAIALVATTVAYAALSTTLQVSGSVTKKGGTWSINIENISSVTTTGTGKMTTAPTSSGTTLSFAAELAKPGDSVSFTFDIVNNGSVDAIWDVNNSRKSIGNNSEYVSWSEEISDEDIVLALAYKTSNGSYVPIMSYQDLLNSGDSFTLKLTLTWNSASHITTKESKTLSVTAEFPFTQA